MSMQNDIAAISTYFSKLGLDPEITDIYSALYMHGPQGVLPLSRLTGLHRTTIYRSLDRLSELGLLEIETHYKRSIYRAAPITNLQTMLAKKEEELQSLQRDLNQLDGTLKQVQTESIEGRVQFYKGPDGLKQMFWNQTKATTETYAILFENMQNKTNSAFFERWVDRCNSKDLRFKGLVGQNFIESQQAWYANHNNEQLRNWEARTVPHDVFPITFSTITYNDVVAHYKWENGTIFGIEVYDRDIAAAQRSHFELLWRVSEPQADTAQTDKEALHS